jgi:hypothetical protein
MIIKVYSDSAPVVRFPFPFPFIFLPALVFFVFELTCIPGHVTRLPVLLHALLRECILYEWGHSLHDVRKGHGACQWGKSHGHDKRMHILCYPHICAQMTNDFLHSQPLIINT